MKNDSIVPIVTPKLVPEQLDLLVAHLIRLRGLYAQARTLVKPAQFNIATEPHYHVLWRAVLDLCKRYGEDAIFGDPAKARALIEAEVAAVLQAEPMMYNPACAGMLIEDGSGQSPLLPYLFEEGSQHQLDLAFGQDLLQKFLYERFVHDPLQKLFRNAGEHTVTNLVAVSREVLKIHSQIEAVGGKAGQALADDWSDFEQRLGFYRGRTMIGLRTSLHEMDEHTMGLRGLIPLGAGPGVGKTALSVQLGVGVCQHNTDAVFVILSLEMDRFALYTRLLCNQARLSWKTVMLGSESCRGKDGGPWFTAADQQRLEEAAAALRDGPLGRRILILDRAVLGDDFADRLLAHVQRFKEKTGTALAFIVVDYLQLLPVPSQIARHGDLEADRHRVQLVQDLITATRTPTNPVGDVMVISETRKPSSSSRSWGSSLADLMGSARIGYAADAVLIYQPMKEEEVVSYGWPSFDGVIHGPNDLQGVGITPVRLELMKARDGMRRGSWGMAFHFEESRFTETVKHATPAGAPQVFLGPGGEHGYDDPLPDVHEDAELDAFAQ